MENSAPAVDFSPPRFPAPRRPRFAMTVAMQAAIRMAKCLALPLTFRNLHVIELALEAESQFAKVSIARAAETILESCQAALAMGECVNYFWFEDCCWRHPKLSYTERDDLRRREQARWH